MLRHELQKDPNNIEKLLKLAQRYGWVKMNVRAIQTYEKVLELDPDNLEALIKKFKRFL